MNTMFVVLIFVVGMCAIAFFTLLLILGSMNSRITRIERALADSASDMVEESRKDQ